MRQRSTSHVEPHLAAVLTGLGVDSPFRLIRQAVAQRPREKGVSVSYDSARDTLKIEGSPGRVQEAWDTLWEAIKAGANQGAA
ncbi:MAG: hypothetical protein ACYC9Q_09195 [Bacillota bacterium]